MPIKFNLTKFDILAGKIKKASTKKEQKEMSKEEACAMRQAIIVASFASGHSWQTYKALTAPNGIQLNSPVVRQEHTEARNSKWKLVTPFNLVEVANMNIPDTTFSQWLFFNADKAEHEEYKAAWKALNSEFQTACDEITQ